MRNCCAMFLYGELKSQRVKTLTNWVMLGYIMVLRVLF